MKGTIDLGNHVRTKIGSNMDVHPFFHSTYVSVYKMPGSVTGAGDSDGKKFCPLGADSLVRMIGK
jgi:hypothetical protein